MKALHFPGWLGAVLASAAVHAAAIPVVAYALRPEPPKDQNAQAAQIQVAAYRVPQTDAQPQTPKGEAARERPSQGADLPPWSVPQVAARAQALRGEAAQALETGAEDAGAADTLPSERLAPASASQTAMAPKPTQTRAASSVDATGQSLMPAVPAAAAKAETVAPDAASAMSAVAATGQALASIRVASPSPAILEPAESAAPEVAVPTQSAKRLQGAREPSAPVQVAATQVSSQPLAQAGRVEVSAGTGLAVAALPRQPAQAASEVATGAEAAVAAKGFEPSQLRAMDASALSAGVVGLGATGSRSAASSLPREAAQSVGAEPQRVSAAGPAARRLPPTDAMGETVASAVVAALAVRRPSLPGVGETLLASKQDTQPVRAETAWSGAATARLDATSLAAAQAFSVGASATHAGIRDTIGDLLASVPCARIQAVFAPEAGEIELRGHIPKPGAQAAPLSQLRSLVGAGIPVVDKLQVLPAPQCNSLARFSRIGLPQSTEQHANPNTIGEEGFVRAADFQEGARIKLAVQAPDYPSFMYVDYFAADGSVLHIQPNEVVPEERYPPKAAFMIGQSDALRLEVSPPFGQEIIIAFAASEPLFAPGDRPLIEPAAAYLDTLAEQIAQARAKSADFKGEWFYFLITTSARQ